MPLGARKSTLPLRSWGPGEWKSKTWVGWGVINDKIVLCMDSLSLAALTQVVIWADGTLVPSSNHFSITPITDNARMFLRWNISCWFAVT